jgi:hypothetical protein
MVFETYTTYDYSFYPNRNYNPTRPPKTHNDIYYHRMQEQQEEQLPANINMGIINSNNKGQQYYEFSYSPMLPKTSSKMSVSNDIKTKENSLLNYFKHLFCCGE